MVGGFSSFGSLLLPESLGLWGRSRPASFLILFILCGCSARFRLAFRSKVNRVWYRTQWIRCWCHLRRRQELGGCCVHDTQGEEVCLIFRFVLTEFIDGFLQDLVWSLGGSVKLLLGLPFLSPSCLVCTVLPQVS